jgi:hypothetical protein
MGKSKRIEGQQFLHTAGGPVEYKRVVTVGSYFVDFVRHMYSYNYWFQMRYAFMVPEFIMQFYQLPEKLKGN